MSQPSAQPSEPSAARPGPERRAEPGATAARGAPLLGAPAAGLIAEPPAEPAASAEGAAVAEGDPGSHEAPVLIHAARGADAEALAAALHEGGMAARLGGGPEDVAARVPEAGCLLVAQDALTPEAVAALGRALTDQPAWSELPVLVLADRVADVFALRVRLEAEWGEAQIRYLTRPVAPLVLMTSVHAALSARMRQFLLRDQLAQETELRRELNHRVKNILVTVQAMAKMTQRSAAGDGARFEAFQSRLGALASVHAMLFDAPGDAARFEEVAEAVLGPFVGADGARVALSGPGRSLNADAAKTLALCVQELVTNAIKYGALSNDQGRVTLRLDLLDGARARLLWQESGGPEVAPPDRRGYGTRYLESALLGLFGAPAALRYDAPGFRLEVEGPSEALIAR